MTRRGCIALLASAPAARWTGQEACPTKALARAAAYLWSRQAADGGWHSATYGLLRSGQSLTPFVLEALLDMGERPAGVERALTFLRRHTSRNGALGLADPDLPDYPNYATALAVKALSRLRGPIEPMVAFLRSQQFTESNGWRRQDPACGAWGMGGERRTPPETGHVDLSMTRHVLEALRAAGAPSSDPAFAAARVYVERCQNSDGGFFFTTTEYDTNKAGHDGRQFRSYGTATADGILALLATGARPDDPHVAAAARWLAIHHTSPQAPGFVSEPYQRWPQGLCFYYAAAASQALTALGLPPPSGIRENLILSQGADGSWRNPSDLVKEDDPLIATPFAIRALLAGGVEYRTDARDMRRFSGGASSFRSGSDRSAPEAAAQR